MEPRIQRDSEVRRSRRHVWQDLGNECVIVDLDAGVQYGLNALGRRIWQLIRTPRSIPALHEALLTEPDVDAVRREHDLVALLEDMQRAGLIEIVGRPS